MGKQQALGLETRCPGDRRGAAEGESDTSSLDQGGTGAGGGGQHPTVRHTRGRKVDGLTPEHRRRLGLLAARSGRTITDVMDRLTHHVPTMPPPEARAVTRRTSYSSLNISEAAHARLSESARTLRAPRGAVVRALIDQATIPELPDIRLPPIITLCRLQRTGRAHPHVTERSRRMNRASDRTSPDQQPAHEWKRPRIQEHRCLDEEAKERLAYLARLTGRSSHEVVRVLIMQATIAPEDIQEMGGMSIVRIRRRPLVEVEPDLAPRDPVA